MSANKSFIIRPLAPTDAAVISAFMQAQPPAYLQFFYAYGADEKEITEMLSAVRTDVHSGVFWQEKLVGVFMLRGWDAGFEIPSFGIVVDEKYRGGTFFRLVLETVKLICRLSGTKRLMAKAHGDNATRRTALRLGFHQTGVEESTGNVIYHMEL